MPITLSEIRTAATRKRAVTARTLNEAKTLALRTAFLCHSHQDRDLVEGVVTLLQESGWNVYVDWNDASMPASPNRTTAAKIKRRIVETDYFLFLATANSMGSRWCPWEIGYADGTKEIDRILIIPTSNGMSTHGNEYLQLYRKVDWSVARNLIVIEPGSTTGTRLTNF